MSYHPPILGFDPDDVDGCLRVCWRDRTVVATIPGGILGNPAEWEAQQEAQEVEEARRQEAISLATNVYLLDSYRSRRNDYRETL